MHNNTENADLPDHKPWLPTDSTWLSLKAIQLPLVVQNQSLHACIRGLALHLMECTYCNIGFYFKSLGTDEIQYLLHTFKQHELELQQEPDEAGSRPMVATQTMTLLCFLLGRAEGETFTSPEFIREALPTLGTLIRIEDMHRKDKLKVNHKNYSLFVTDRPVVINKTIKELDKMFKEQD
jgi:hypothetical protein